MFHVVWTLLIKMKQKRDVTNIFKEAICYSIWVCMNVSLCNDFGQLFYLLYIKICICKQKHWLCVLFYSMLYTYLLTIYCYIYIPHTHTHTHTHTHPHIIWQQLGALSYLWQINVGYINLRILCHWPCHAIPRRASWLTSALPLSVE